MTERQALRRRAWRGVTVAAVTWIGAAAATAAPEAGILAAALVIAAGGAVALFVRFRRPAVLVATVALACAAAAGGTVAALAPTRAAIAHLEVDGGRHLRVTATVTGHVSGSADGGAWFDATVSAVSAGDTTVRGVIPARIGVDAERRDRLSAVGQGSEVVLSGRAVPADPAERAVLVLRATEVERAPPPEGVWAVFEDLRDGLIASTRGLPQPGAGLIPGLAVGDTSGLDAATEAAMKTSSLSHLTAVSGANCALVVGAAFALLAVSGARRWLRVVGALLVLTGFVVLVTPEPSVVRAAAMSAIGILALGLGRPTVGVAVLAAAVTVLLIADPWLCRSLGFALSTAATAALLVLARPLADGLGRWMPAPLALALAVPTSAQLVCGPLIVLIDPHVPLLGVAANLLADPAAAPATIAGVLACVLPVPWLRDGLTAVAWIPAAWIAGVAHTTASAPAQNLPWPDGPLGAALLTIAGGAVAVALARPRRVPRITALATLTVAVLVGAIGGTSTIRTVAGPLTIPSGWQVAMCDVGQGDATLWRSGSAAALVDTGPEPEPLAECLATLGIDHLDLVVLTHFDKDHVGGSEAVLGRADLVVHGPIGEPADQRLLDRFAAGGSRLQPAAVGLTGGLGDTRWQALGPLPGMEPGNDASVVIDVSGPGFPRMVMLGDLGAEPQAALLRRVDVPRVEIVKVSHHGSADQDPALYHRLQARVGLIGVGAGNTYGHPTLRLLDILQDTGTVVARTDTDGILAVWHDEEERLTLWRQRAP
ncbi:MULTISPECIES: ComEC/Rec2 family competence protein [Microbacterium]|jgi:competence protein ComEC|uniref:ComEC/Rec2 family competence protein n=1 Tax=Microbacterium TaxID=33882 RepID=UPI001D17D1A4|nr:ComEC/Rec2 family competence protein [Microbacterium testaceum]MCC4248980.1 ComEC/Rec2 family competence protein [Microbacterium testaceum]